MLCLLGILLLLAHEQGEAIRVDASKPGPSATCQKTSQDNLDPWTYCPSGPMPAQAPLHYQGQQQPCSGWIAEAEGSGFVPEFAKWHFAPPGAADWRKFDAQSFCKHMVSEARSPVQARLLFIGDSLSHHAMQSLMMVLNSTALVHPQLGAHLQDKINFEARGKNQVGLACNGQLWVQQEGSQNLRNDYARKVFFKEQLDWLQSFDVVVLRLPWGIIHDHVSLADFWTKALLPEQKLLVWTSTPGHERAGVNYDHTPNASGVSPLLAKRPHRAPLRTAGEMAEYFKSIDGHRSWRGMREDLELGINVFRSKNATVADIFYLSGMMWDRHRDPLHYCLPGPIDRWLEVLYNYLVRGHLDDFQQWSDAFARAVTDIGGLKNAKGQSFTRKDIRS